ncbi:GAF and ANTAR domain-containing protein [Acidimicrobiia bacterium EGI L10123]|uniref:GAF and ANTAR domain-containing protein n=1 Tax=Salinilacustrithrix flava TaxID=2957203 RepID=UPI003D7C319E|nr:GAF and ANTAR domain-containing protein [Acidimicrobiia bacterium EGI L10123]
MIDEGQLRQALANVAESLARDRSVADVLHDLVDDATRVFDICGAGISMADAQGRLRSVTALSESIASLEMIEERTRQGPCHEVHDLGKPLRISDLRDHADRWPDLARAAEKAGVVAAAGVPLHIEDAEFGVLTLYDTRPRQWTDRQIEAAQLLADTTTGYIVYASAYREATEVVAQLEHALETRIIVEQAKGVLANERSISVDAALQILRRHARNHNAKLSVVAHAVVNLDLRP